MTQPSNLSPTDRDKVLAVWPKAVLLHNTTWGWGMFFRGRPSVSAKGIVDSPDVITRLKKDAWKIAAQHPSVSPSASQEEKCGKTLYDQDDGERSYCQLPKGHTEERCTPWPESNNVESGRERNLAALISAPLPAIQEEKENSVSIPTHHVVDKHEMIPTSLPESLEDRLLAAINWLMGCGDGSFEKPDGAPVYWWRIEFANRAGLGYDGSKYTFDPAPLPAPAGEEKTDVIMRAARAIDKHYRRHLRGDNSDYGRAVSVHEEVIAEEILQPLVASVAKPSVETDKDVLIAELKGCLADILAWTKRGQRKENNRADEAYNRALSTVEMYIEERSRGFIEATNGK